MVHRIRLIRCEELNPGARHYTPPEMYDDHLIPWMAHQYQRAGAVGQPVRKKRERPEPCERPKRPVESNTHWWPHAGACAAHFGLTKSTVRSCCNGYIKHVRGRNWRRTALRYSPHATREAWEAARLRRRELRERRAEEQSVAMLA